jgi:CLIP-associating protein 1/2
MRARAEQAASAADRLLELVDQDLDDESTVLIDLDDEKDPHPANAAILLHSPIGETNRRPHGGTTENGGDRVRIAATLPLRPVKLQVPHVTNIWGGKVHTEVPKTPAVDRGNKVARNQRGAAIMKQAALLLDSPVAAKTNKLVTGDEETGGRTSGSILDLLKEKKTGRDWWVKRMNCRFTLFEAVLTHMIDAAALFCQYIGKAWPSMVPSWTTQSNLTSSSVTSKR